MVPASSSPKSKVMLTLGPLCCLKNDSITKIEIKNIDH